MQDLEQVGAKALKHEAVQVTVLEEAIEAHDTAALVASVGKLQQLQDAGFRDTAGVRGVGWGGVLGVRSVDGC